MKRTFEQTRAYLAEAALSEQLEVRRQVLNEVRSDPKFFASFSAEEQALLRDIYSDVVNGALELASSAQPVL